METRLEIQTELTPMLFAVSTSTYFTPTRIQEAISRANLWAGDEQPWPSIKKGFITNSVALQPYYDYPENCQSESIFRMSLDGVSKYAKKDFVDFQNFTEDNPSSVEKYFTEYGRQIFFTPMAATNGIGNLIFWGLIQAGALTGDGSETMFSGWASATNEAILLRAYAYLIKNIDANKANDAILEAKAIITKCYDKIAKRTQKKQRIHKPLFIVPDYFNGSSNSRTGNFGPREG